MTFFRRSVNKKRINTFRTEPSLTKAREFRRDDVHQSLIDVKPHAAYTGKKIYISAYRSMDSIDHPGGSPSGK
jgi:hypothetical protein